MPKLSSFIRNPLLAAPAFVAVLSIMMPPFPLMAGDILRGGARPNVARPGAVASEAAAVAAQQARSNAQDALSRTTQALSAVRAMQSAARSLSLNGPNNLGPDPNHPGLMLPNVPDGLTPGGLQIAGAPVGAGLPAQANVGGRAVVNIQQTAQQALLNWTTFNVGKNTTVKFDQSAGGADVGKWIAFNKVSDPSGSPSQILGSIEAPGQVYVINQNGIIFGGSSQVNTHILVASSLPINDNLIDRGLLNNPDAQFLFSALAMPAGTKGPTPAFTPPPLPANGKIGDVTVQPGAQLIAPTTAANVGGRVVLVGPNVTNAGTISTPDGQTILAAGLQVGFDAHKSSDPSLRGLDVYVGAVKDPGSALPEYAGTATNAGLIDAPRANVTIAGKTVNQLGAINSSTSVSLNGRVDLQASYGALRNTSYDPVKSPDLPPFLNTASGNVTLGAGSIIQILPEWSSTDRVVGTELALRSQVNVQGKSIYLAPESIILAPNAIVNISAGNWDLVQSGSFSQSTFVNTAGQIYLDRNAMINVAGSTDVAAALTEHILTLTLRGAEFADSPLQRTSIFRPGDGTNPSITVDLRKTGTYNGRIWYGTPLADLSGYLGLIQRDVGELTVQGGTVKLNAGGSIVVQSDARIDVSGGFLNFSGGMVKTTRVWYAGHLFDIADATPDRLFEGIYDGKFIETHARWGVTKTYTDSLALTGEHYEQPYISGANGGVLNFFAPSMALDGDLYGNTFSGPRQRSSPPTPSALSIDFQAQQPTIPYLEYSPTPPTVTFDESKQAAVAPFALDASGNPLPLREDRIADVFLSPGLLNERGFGIFNLENSEGNVLVPKRSKLDAGPKGSITMTGANIEVQGSLIAPGGAVTLSVFNISPSVAEVLKEAGAASIVPVPNTNRGNFILGSSATVSTAGLIIDDRLSAPAPASLPLVTNGGSVSITTYNADLAAGSLIDVSGGFTVSPFGKIAYGDAGSISIKTGQDPNLLSVTGGHLKLGGRLLGYSGARGGSLILQAPVIQIGGGSPSANALLLSPDFFSEGGFSSFTLTGLGEATGVGDEVIPGISIASGTIIEPVVESYVAVLNAFGSDTAEMRRVIKPEGLRSPANITLNAPGITDDFTGILSVRGDLVIGANARIQTDALGSINLKGSTVAVYGSLIAPGGTISITGSSNSINAFPNRPEAQTEALVTVYLAPGSTLSTAGKVLLLPDRWGNRTGSVLSGGAISVSGNILAEAGATLDVSGTTGILDLPPAYLGMSVPRNGPLGGSTLVPVTSGLTSPLYQAYTVPTRVDSNAGSITLKGGQELYTAANLLGKAGGPTALGGNLSISSGRFYPLTTQPQDKKPTDPTLRVTQDDAGFAFSSGGVGRPVLDFNGAVLQGQGQFAVDYFAHGGFDALLLGGTIDFSGPVNINARRAIVVGVPSSSSALDGGIIFADSTININAPYVALGKPFSPPKQVVDMQNFHPFEDGLGSAFHFPPTYGPGQLNVTADLIDIGYLSLQGIGAANLIANQGDIRGQGTLDIAGRLLLRAGQIYPVTASPFTIAAYDYVVGGNTLPGTVTIEGSGVRQLPLSAGGTLSVYGSVITQGGTLRAPIGTINLGWDGTGTAPNDNITGQGVAVTQQLTLAAGSVTSVSAVDPRTGEGIVIPYGINPFGSAWIDPTGLDITVGNAPAKGINLSAQSLAAQAGSVIDISGGGDLYAYQFVKGNGGSKDILASSSSFAVIPGYEANYMPYAPFSISGAGVSNLNGDSGYLNNTLSVGDRIFLNSSPGLASGTYTLLPARYALLPGAFLVTPQSGTPIGTFAMPDGSMLVNGYRFNDLNSSRTVPSIYSRFEVANSTVIHARAQYEDFYANAFLRESAVKLDQKVPRLPMDGGYLLFSASQAMALQGSVNARGSAGGRGGLVDINSPIDIVIAGSGVSGGPGTLTLDSSLLNSYGADSILIGGFRTFSSGTTTVNVRTNNLTVNNAGTPLAGPEIILVAKQNLSLASGSSIVQTGSLSDSSDVLLLGDDAVAGSGDGTLLRVSSDMAAQIIRSGVTSSSVPNFTVGAGVFLSGSSLILDSTAGMSLDPTVTLDGEAISLNAGRISMQLNNPGALQPNPGLILTGGVLQSIQLAQALSLLSYSSLDIYGTGQVRTGGSLALHAAEIRGFNNGGGTVNFAAPTILLDNAPGRPSPGSVAALSGTLVFDAKVITIGVNQLNIDQFATVDMNAPGGVLMQSAGGLATQGDLNVATPLLTGARGATQTLVAAGALNLTVPVGALPTITGGLGASLSLKGASVSAASDIVLPSGVLSMQATSGALTIAGNLDVSGTAQTFFDQVRYTDAGQIMLTSNAGSVNVNAGARLNVAAVPGGGNAGTLTINTPSGAFNLAGTMSGGGGVGGLNGVFSLDVGTLADYTTLNNTLNAASFTQSRNIRVRGGDVNVTGITKAHSFSLAADQGSINVTGSIDATGLTGGAINLVAWKSVVLQNGSLLDVSGQSFSNAGKGGAVSLEAGSSVFFGGSYAAGPGAVLDIQTGSLIKLSVAENVPGSSLVASAGTSVSFPHTANGYDTIIATSAGSITLANGTVVALAANTPTSVVGGQSIVLNSAGTITFGGSAASGDFTGTLHLRAPQNIAGTNLSVNPINGTITDASSITIEGYKIFTPAGGNIATAAAELAITNGLTTFGNNALTVRNNLLAGNADVATLTPITVVVPGAEVINRTGDITLGTTATTSAVDWNLGAVRYGANSVPGVLTLRAAGNIVLNNAVSDGFSTSAYTSALMPYNALLPANMQSWSYRLTSGADFSAADIHRVQSLAALDASFAGKGSLLLGKNGGSNNASTSGANATTASAVNAGTGRFQVIRTGTGDIDISAGRNVELLNQFASIYTVGALITDSTMGGTFATPSPSMFGSNVGNLGANQQIPPYPAQYTMGGGNVSITAGVDILHQTKNSSNVLIADSERELPMNWLYRRGYVDPVTGLFGNSRYGEIASTSWWVDFSNFFEGVGALGGGNVTLIAGRDVTNVDGLAPTNARMAGKISGGAAIAPDASNLVELGGGDVTVRAGRNIDGGVYYVERGAGTLNAGGSITTNATRTPSLGILKTPVDILSPETWLPTTLFLGKGGYNVSARGDALLGPITNPFLLPQGYSNTYWYKTYFSTYDTSDYVNVSSLGGSVTFRESVTLPSAGSAGVSIPVLQAFMQRENLLVTSGAGQSASNLHPWLRLAEDSLTPFSTVFTLMPSTLRATSFSGDINLVGNINLSPSPFGTADFMAAGDFNALQINGASTINSATVKVWTSGRINLSDADPMAVPGAASPFAYQTLVGTATSARSSSLSPLGNTFLSGIDKLFAETGSTTGSAASVQTKQALHGSSILHAADTIPLRIYAKDGDISGFTLFSGKPTSIIAGHDITDVAFYLQNVNEDNISLVSAGRDIVAYNANSSLRVSARAIGNILSTSDSIQAGDLQISGPGTLEILAGRNLDLGTGSNNADGTGVGLTSIGNGRNPNLAFEGADIIAAAGLGSSGGLDGGALNFDTFIDQILRGTNGTRYFTEYAAANSGTSITSVEELDKLPVAQRNAVALDLFYLALRDAGRDYATAGNYDSGLSAITTLFPDSTAGDITTRSRDIRTKSGGNISLLTPGGGLTLQTANTGSTLVPPGIITEYGGNINIFANNDVNIGISRIFTLRGGDIMIWSSTGDIAAGASSKTVASAPPTRVLIDPQSADIATDLAGLATGGGIGVLATVKNVPPGNVDLIAPMGTVDAGDAGIRATGNLTIAANAVLNASNIAVSGSSTGTPSAPSVAAPNIGGMTSASNTAGASNSAADAATNAARPQDSAPMQDLPSIITVEVIGYGGGSGNDEDAEEEKRRRKKEQELAPPSR